MTTTTAATATTSRRRSSMERWRRKKEPRSAAIGGGGGGGLLVYVVFVALLSLCPAGVTAEETQLRRGCSVGLQTPGHTWPAGDIVLEYGNPLHIKCILNQTFDQNSRFNGKTSADLVFFKGHHPVDPAYVSVVNESTIALNIADPAPQNEMYYCKLKLDSSRSRGKDYEAVCLNKVVVGFKPMAPSSFDCVSHNWENLTCTWKPAQNYVDTVFSITYKLAGRAGGRKLYACPSSSKLSEPGKVRHPNFCTWNTKSEPIYRQPYDYYFFNLTGENVLGSWSRIYKFHHFANVIPSKPTNLTVVNKTFDMATLHWSVTFPMQTFPPGMHHKVEYQSEWDKKDDWKVIKITNETHATKKYYNLTDLRYANAVYDVRVYMKSAVALDEDDKWSNFSDVTFRTPAQIPGQSPRTDLGSFEIMENRDNRDVYLYWQTIPPWLENGNNFTYVVHQTEENGKHVSMPVEPTELTTSFAKFRGLGFLSNYWFEVASSNEVGVRDGPAKIFVPSRASMPKEPVAFTKIAFEEDGLFELSWKPPVDGDDKITNYTIFWCENDKDRPYQCTGFLDWVHVPKTVLTKNVTVPHPEKVYQFAISANTLHASSGMMWASCTVIHDRVVGKMKTVWINRIGSTNIEVGWKLDCSDRIGIIEGFKIYYCPIISPYNNNCKEPKQNVTIKADLNTIRGEVKGLKPYTTYMISVAVLSKNGEGLHSDPLYNTTLEAAPSNAPTDVIVRNVTNTTMFIEWTKPVDMNGVLTHYIIYYDELTKKIEKEYPDEEMSHAELTGLQANRNYTISVTACTNECSALSSSIHAMTEIGVPSKLPQPTVKFINSSHLYIKWAKPQFSAGPISYYQIKNYDDEIQNTTKLESSLVIPDCNSEAPDKPYSFSVRAVNIAGNGEHLFGNWSDLGETSCFAAGFSYEMMIVMWVIGSISGIVFVFGLAYSCKIGWEKYKDMQDVEVKLPPGLAPHMKLLDKGDNHKRHLSADSIGRTSNPESITSSLTTHHSCVSTDSGAEVDSSDLSPHQIVPMKLSDSNMSDPAWEAVSLGQKCFTNATKSIIKPEDKLDPYMRIGRESDGMMTSNEASSDTKSLTRSTPNLNDNLGGFGITNQNWSSTGYISMPSSEEISESSTPVPKNNAHLAHYSVLSIPANSPGHFKPEEKAASLAKTQTEMEVKSSTNPYVSLISLDQKTKGVKNQALDSFQILNDLNLTSSSLTAPQEKSSPYVQTCFLDLKASPALSSFDSRQMMPAQASPSTYYAQSSLAQELSNKLTPMPAPTSKPYVTIASLAETQQLQQKKPVATVLPNILSAPAEPLVRDFNKCGLPDCSTMEGVNKSGDLKPANPGYLPLQQALAPESLRKAVEDHTNASHYSSLGLEPKDVESRPSSSCSSSSSGYICLNPEEQTKPQVEATPSAKVSGYVTLPDQKLFAKPPPPQQMTGSDEQYSKVAALPRTMH